MNQEAQEKGSRIRLVLLGIGAVVGLLAAAHELASRGDFSAGRLPDNVVARVGPRDISLDRYRRVLDDLDADRRGPLTAEDRAFAMQRLVDEELLVLRGLEMGLGDAVPEVRKALVRAVISQTLAEAEAASPTREQLRDLYTSDPAFFASAAQYRVIWLREADDDETANARALEAAAQLRGGKSPDAVAAATGYRRTAELPDALLPLAKLRDYLGPELANAVSEQPAGAAVGPLVTGGAINVLYLAERMPQRLPPFEEIVPLVEAEFTRRRGGRALQDLLHRLRRETHVLVDEDKLAWP